MFGTMGFSELIIILVIVLIIFGAGRLPQIGEGVGKALKGFKKEVNELPPPVDPNAPEQESNSQAQAGPEQIAPPNPQAASPETQSAQSAPPSTPANQPYKPGPELTPGTTAALLYKGAGPEAVKPRAPQETPQTAPPSPADSVPGPVTMEERAAQAPQMAAPQYPPLPPSARTQAPGKRPSAIVNKQAVARVQAQQAAIKEKQARGTASPQDMQSLGEGLGSALRTFRDAAADVKNSIDPEMKTIQAELQSAEKEMQDTIETAKQPILPKDPPSTT